MTPAAQPAPRDQSQPASDPTSPDPRAPEITAELTNLPLPRDGRSEDGAVSSQRRRGTPIREYNPTLTDQDYAALAHILDQIRARRATTGQPTTARPTTHVRKLDGQAQDQQEGR